MQEYVQRSYACRYQRAVAAALSGTGAGDSQLVEQAP